MTQTDSPIVCTLTTKEAAEQVFEWTDLQRHATHSQRMDQGAAMTFPVELADSVEDLAARERDCCGSFLSIVTTRSDADLRLEITSTNPDALPIIEAMAGLTH